MRSDTEQYRGAMACARVLGYEGIGAAVIGLRKAGHTWAQAAQLLGITQRQAEGEVDKLNIGSGPQGRRALTMCEKCGKTEACRRGVRAGEAVLCGEVDVEPYEGSDRGGRPAHLDKHAGGQWVGVGNEPGGSSWGRTYRVGCRLDALRGADR